MNFKTCRLTLLCAVAATLMTAAALAEDAASQDAPIEVVFNRGGRYSVEAVASSPDGFLVLSTQGNTPRLWDVATGRLLRVFGDPAKEKAAAVAFSPDGTSAFSGSLDKTVKQWDLSTGKVLRAFTGHSAAVLSIAISPDGKRVLSGSADNTARLWNAADGRLLRTFIGHSDRVRSVALSRDGKRVVSTSRDYTLKLWDSETGELVRSQETDDSLGSVAFSPDGTRIAAGSESIECRESMLFCGACYCRGKAILTSTARTWDVETGKLLRTLRGERMARSDGATPVSFSPDGRYLLWGGTALQMSDAASGELVRTFDTGSKTIFETLAISPDGAHLVASFGIDVALWDANTGNLLRRFPGLEKDIRSAFLSSNGDTMVIDEYKQGPSVWDIVQGRPRRKFSELTTTATLSPDGSRVLAGMSDADGRATLREVASGKILFQRDKLGSVDAVVFSADGKRVAIEAKNTLMVLNAMTGSMLRQIKHGDIDDLSAPLALSPNGSQAVIVEQDKNSRLSIKLYDVSNGRMVRSIALDASITHVGAVGFSPDGTHVLSANNDWTITLWDIASGKLLQTFRGHSAWINSIVISSDGARLFSASNDSTVKTWDMASGKLLSSQTVIGGAPVAVVADGTRAVLKDSGLVKVWGLSQDALLATLFIDKDGEWVAFTPEGFFDASREDTQLISFVRGLKLVDGAYKAFHRPDLLAEKLAGDPNGKVKAAAREAAAALR